MTTPVINFENLVQPHWSMQDKNNAQLAVEFVQTIMNRHDFDAIVQKFSNSEYVQHNRSMTDGINGVVTSLRELTKRFPEFSYDVKRISVDGDMVTLHSHATVNYKHRGNDKKGFNIIDTWRVSEGQLVEHWDAIQPLDNFMRLYYWLTGGAIRNTNGVF